ncbi:MAG: SGNH/GDSL hydrolase family protein [bacterium]
MSSRKKIALALIFIIVVGVAIYLNRSYAYIYSKFELTVPPAIRNYMTQNQTETTSSISYVALGDSLTAGVGASSASSSFPALLAQKIANDLNQQIVVTNLGVPGAKSFDMLTGQVMEATKFNPQIITIFIGTNDIHNFVPVGEFKNNLITTVKSLREMTEAKIYFINIPYLGTKDLIHPPYDYYFNFEIQRYNKVLVEVANEVEVPVIDLYLVSKKMRYTAENLFCIDEFHPNDAGYKFWADNIQDVFKTN